jgi:hypothetical protein
VAILRSDAAAGETIDLVLLEAATQDLAHATWELERLAARAEDGELKDGIERLRRGLREALVHHREVLAGRA